MGISGGYGMKGDNYYNCHLSSPLAQVFQPGQRVGETWDLFSNLKFHQSPVHSIPFRLII